LKFGHAERIENIIDSMKNETCFFALGTLKRHGYNRTMKFYPYSPSFSPLVFPWLIKFAKYSVDAPHIFIIREKQCDPSVEDRNLDGVVRQD